MLREEIVDGLRITRSTLDNGVLVAFTDRDGGRSREPYRSLNLAARVGDDVSDVDANRTSVARALGFGLADLSLARQVHGREVIEVTGGMNGVVGEADALVTSTHGRVLGILTADCAPVVLIGRGRVGVVHAGWRGLVAGAIEAGVDAVGDVERAVVGPAIHSCCYVVGPDVIDAFAAHGLPVAAPDRVDPAVAAADRLRHLGIEDVTVATECTSCDPRYFSFRRAGVTGRQGGFVALLP